MSDRDRQNFLNQMCRNMNLSMRMGIDLETTNEPPQEVGPLHYTSLSSLSASMSNPNFNQSYKSEKSTSTSSVNPFVNPYRNPIQPINTRLNYPNNFQTAIMPNINQPYTINNPTAYNPYANFCNPLIIQNYYALYNQNRNNTIINTPYINPSYNKTYANVPQIINNYNNVQNKYAMTNNTIRPKTLQNNHQYSSRQDYQRNFNQDNFSNMKSENIESDWKRTYNDSPVTKEEQDEIQKWIDARKRNFPSINKVLEKKEIGKKMEQLGMISELEKKLREKIKIMRSLDKKGYRNKERNNLRDKRRRHKKKNSKPISEIPEEGEIVEETQMINTEIQVDNKNEEDLEITDKNEIFLKKRNRNDNNRENDNINSNKDKKLKDKNQRIGFKYKKSLIYENLIKSDKIKEMNIILQVFRYFVNEKLV